MAGNDWSSEEQIAVMENGIAYSVAEVRLLKVKDGVDVVIVLVVPFRV